VSSAAICLEGITKTFDGTQEPAVAPLDLTLGAGEISVLIGPSGCGKTTTMRMINRLIEPVPRRALRGSAATGGRCPSSGRRPSGAAHGRVTFGGSAQCIEREDCLLGYQSDEFYGLSFADVRTLEYGPPLAAGLLSGDIQAAQYQTTAPEIASGDLVVLEDDLGLLSADNIVPIFRSEVADEDLIALLDELSEALTTEDLIEWNEATDIENEEPAEVATAWLEDNGLL
jgi:energy-coupling factor transporter ATP-binding protein EcfA2